MTLAHVLTMTVAGTPRPRPRPRHGARIGKNGQAYSTTYHPKKLRIDKRTGKPTPESLQWVRAEQWYNAVKDALAAHPDKPSQPLEGPLKVDIEVFLERPAYLDETYADGTFKHPAGEQWAPVTPDRDNLDKSATDALKEAGLYKDDALIVDGATTKFYHARGAGPGTILAVFRILTTPDGEPLVGGKPPKTPRPIQRKGKKP